MGRLLQAQWMQTKAHGDDDDERLNLHRIRSISLHGRMYCLECW
jgi:hypothetical protein